MTTLGKVATLMTILGVASALCEIGYFIAQSINEQYEACHAFGLAHHIDTQMMDVGRSDECVRIDEITREVHIIAVP